MISPIVIAAGVFVALLLALGMVIGVNERIYDERRMILEQRIGRRRSRGDTTLLLRNQGVEAPPMGQVGLRIDDLIKRSGMDLTVPQFLLFSAGLAFAGIAAGAQVFGWWGVLGAMLGAAPALFLQQRRAALVRTMELQLPGTLDVMISALRGGATIDRAIAQAATESEEPIATELRHVEERLRLGAGLGDALQSARNRQDTFYSFHFVLSIMQLSQRTGGNLIRMMVRVRDAQRELLAMTERIRTASAEVRTTGRVMFGLPIIVISGMSLFFPSYLAPLMAHPIGRSALLLTAGWMAIGVVIMNRLSRVVIE